MSAGRRIVRVSVYHAGTFRAMLTSLSQVEGAVCYRGRYYRLAWCRDGVQIYREQEDPLPWLRSRVADYEHYLATRLAQGVITRDGRLRPRTIGVVRGAHGAYRQRRWP